MADDDTDAGNDTGYSQMGKKDLRQLIGEEGFEHIYIIDENGKEKEIE